MSKTYYLRSTAEATAVSAFAIEHAAALTAGASSASDSVVLSGGAAAVIAYTTATNQPDSAAWPTGGAGTPYRCIMNCTAIGATSSFGLLNNGAGNLGFRRTDSTTASLEQHAQAESAFTTTGIKTATYSSTWTAGSASDRFSAEITVARTASHGNETTTIEVDDPTANATNGGIVDGPWDAGGGGQEPPPKRRVISQAVKRAGLW